MMKKCLSCDISFKVPKSRSNAKYCSNNCRFKAQKTNKNVQRNRVEIKCQQCDKIFEKQKSRTKRFCSRKCYWDFRNENPEVKIQSNQEINLITKVCNNCNKAYEVNKYRNKTSKFCSISCYNNFRRESIICPSCKNGFKSPKYEKRKYCSLECVSKGIDKRKSNFSKSVYDFLIKYYNIEDEFFIIINNRKIFADFYLPEYKIVIECNGDYWHCNPKVYEGDFFHKQIRKTAIEIWDYDNKRKQLLENNGYNVITFWEYDWNNEELFFNNLKNSIEDEIHKNKKN